MLEAMLGIQTALNDFVSAEADVRDILYQVSLEVRQIYLHRDLFDTQERLIQLQSTRNVINSGLKAANGLFSGNIFAVANGAAQIFLEEDIEGLKIEANDIQQDYYLSEKIGAIAEHLGRLRNSLDSIEGTYERIQLHLSKLNEAQQDAMKAYADMLGLDEGLGGRVFPYNTAMRRRQNTVRIRYQNALKRGKKLAFIAKRAIEFRLGIDMSSMNRPMTLVSAPQEWANRVCELEGFDYDKIRDMDDPDLEGLDHYAHMYLGDYVRMLEDFVESYNMDYPFTDETDIAVLSMKNDVVQSKRECEVENYNLLIYSDQIGEHLNFGETNQSLKGGWYVGGCKEEDGDYACIVALRQNDKDSAYCDSEFCFGENFQKYESDPPHEAERLRDTPFGEGSRPNDYENTGYFYQIIPDIGPGHYIVSWWAHLPNDADNAVEYWVDVVSVDDEYLIGSSQEELVPPSTWKRKKFHFRVDSQQDLKLRIHPSREDNADKFGDVWVWGVQLERIEPWRKEVNEGDWEDVEALPYQETNESRFRFGEYCSDHDGLALRRKHFERLCLCEAEKGICEPGTEGSDIRHCFWQTTFSFNLEDIENGNLIPSHNISLRNYNYRHEGLAVNLVGTNVRDCSGSDIPETCHSNAFIPYTLVHSGKVSVRNHTGDTVNFYMPTARIEYGKGLAAETLVTNPPSSTHNQLLQEYLKTGLRGRPLQGEYVLRIWDVPELKWENVEDIQLIWKYRYWTRMSYGD
jgi:hypothetical protein